jgi:hypothetical protein
MGSYFSKPNHQKNIPFEALERSVESLNLSQYPTFDRTTEWSKTRHIYSEQICMPEKYMSWTIILVLFLFLFSFLYLSYTTTIKDSIPNIDIPIDSVN